METRYAIHPDHAKLLDTAGLRREFLIQDLFLPGALKLVYSHVDRMLVGAAVPSGDAIDLVADQRTLGSNYFLERRELGVINLGGPGVVQAEAHQYTMNRLDGLYVGKGTKSIRFNSAEPANPAKFYFASGMAHHQYPTSLIAKASAKRVPLGSLVEANQRTIHQVIHPDLVQTCSLVMGFTSLEPGSTWNTMPSHTHERRMEVYLYFDVPADAFVLHLMGQPQETRHIVMRNEEAVISPSWSIHSGVGSRNYSFVWAMVGENQTFTDMDAVGMDAIR